MEKYEDYTSLIEKVNIEKEKINKAGQEVSRIDNALRALSEKKISFLARKAKGSFENLVHDHEYADCTRMERISEDANEASAILNEINNQREDILSISSSLKDIDYADERKEFVDEVSRKIEKTLEVLSENGDKLDDCLNNNFEKYINNIEINVEDKVEEPKEEIKVEEEVQKVESTEEVNKDEFNFDELAEEFQIKDEKIDTIQEEEEETKEEVKAEEKTDTEEKEDSFEEFYSMFNDDLMENNHNNVSELKNSINDLNNESSTPYIEETKEIKLDDAVNSYAADLEKLKEDGWVLVTKEESMNLGSNKEDENKVEENNEFDFSELNKEAEEEMHIFGRRAA